jgi:osmotically-inducible protein OsmY
MLTAMGIEGFAERARRELLATGETARKRSVEAFAELTAQETQIAKLGRDGRTNQEISTQLFLVQDALDRWALIPDDSDVTVDTKRNTVTLSGHVRTWAEHDAAVDATWMASGVYDVNDDLTITG